MTRAEAPRRRAFTAPQACRQPQPPAAPTPPVAERLEEAWLAAKLAGVSDRELPQCIDALIDHHVRVGFFDDRMEGMRRVGGFGPHGDVEVQLAPNRHKVPVARDAAGAGHCGLCDPSFPSERGLSWRGWRVWPNAFPYLPAAKQHILLTAAAHLPQSFSTAILGDMLDFQTAAAGGRPLTLHYNGVAGNSQFHLHWQATRERLPLERALDAGRLPLTAVVRAAEGRVQSYDDGFFAGLLVSGGKPFVQRWAARIIERLNHDPQTRGAYNLLLLQPRGGAYRLAIVPRRADNLRPEVGSIGRAGVGAFNAGGIQVMPLGEVPEDFGRTITAAMRSTLVPPGELAWLEELGREPRTSLDAIRLRSVPADLAAA